MVEPLALPVTPENVELKQVVAVGLAVSPFSFQSQAQDWGGERWDAVIDFPRGNRASSRLVKAFMIKLRGSISPFLMGDPACPLPLLNTRDVGVQVNGAHARGTRVLQTKNWQTDDPEGFALRAGDYIQLGSGVASRLHFVTDDVVIDDAGLGLADINIWPALRSDYLTGSTVVYRYPVGVFRMKAGNSAGWSESPGLWDDMTFEAMEYLT
jgi:hypothetical protein